MLRDLRFALHLIVKDRWYSAVAIVALALGIGLNATVFTLVNAVLIRGLPFKDSASLYMLGSVKQGEGGNGGSSVSLADLEDWRSQSRTFAGLAGFSNNGANLSDETSAPQQARIALGQRQRLLDPRSADAPRPRLRARRRPQRGRTDRHHRVHAVEDALRDPIRTCWDARSASTARPRPSSASCPTACSFPPIPNCGHRSWPPTPSRRHEASDSSRCSAG